MQENTRSLVSPRVKDQGANVISPSLTKKVTRLMLKNKDVELKHFSEVNKKFDTLFKANHELIGRVLKCHLIIEKYLNDYLEFFYGKDFTESINLRFYQKLVLLKSKSVSMNIIFEGIQEINQIRNKFAHKLNTSITINDVKSCKPFVDALLSENSTQPVNVIEGFTNIVCILIADDISDVGATRRQQIEKLFREQNKLSLKHTSKKRQTA
ncbi:MAG: hypothetical protein V1747_04020 [Candidatus Omnitrophota bacterium]